MILLLELMLSMEVPNDIGMVNCRTTGETDERVEFRMVVSEGSMKRRNDIISHVNSVVRHIVYRIRSR